MSKYIALYRNEANKRDHHIDDNLHDLPFNSYSILILQVSDDRFTSIL